MENKSTHIKKAIFLNNGRSLQNNLIHSTKFKNKEKIYKMSGNGKIFQEQFEIAIDKKNKTNFTKKNILNWVLDTLNPLNHLPVISTINKITSGNNKSLDMTQSAIGGALFVGGPTGVAKGIGNWFINKIIPNSTNISSTDIETSRKEAVSKSNAVKEKKITDEKGDEKINTSLKIFYPPKNEHEEKNKNYNINFKNSINYNFFYNQFRENKSSGKEIDTDA